MALATDGSRETVVVRNPANDSFPLWSADGSRLLFLSDRTGSNALWTVPIDDGRPNGQPALLKPDVGPIRLLGLTKSGALYYLEPSAGRPNLYLSDLEAVHATKPPVPLTERIINYNIGPSWSRDGQYLAYYSFREPPSSNRSAGLSGALVIRSEKTGDERTVALPARASSRFGAGPKWFPDNRSVLVEFRDAEGSGFGFYRLVLDTGNTELLAHLSAEISSYDLSPDGRTIFYAIGFASSGQKLLRYDIDSHRETELRDFPVGSSSEIVALAVSPDGLQLAMTIIGGAVEVMPAAGGQARAIFSPAARELGTGSLLQGLTWTPDQRFLLFARGDRSFWRAPALGGEAEKVGILVGVKSPAVHPDGRRIVFSSASGPNTSKVWALDNVLPQSSTRP
jgi:Tol biopolymer transport system component